MYKFLLVALFVLLCVFFGKLSFDTMTINKYEDRLTIIGITIMYAVISVSCLAVAIILWFNLWR